MTSAIPGKNAEGHLTWNPSVGLHHEPASGKRESYGGIIGALQDQITKVGTAPKAYPENFAGIIAAIQDLTFSTDDPPVEIGPKPPGQEIIVGPDGDPEWIITDKPKDGTLWFDTRQGRLFVWLDTDWYQTNGGDGIPIVTPDNDPPAIDVGVPGQFWYDNSGERLYIFTGMYSHADSSVNTDPENGTMIWKLVADLDQDFLQTTATLPLVGSGLTHPDDDYFDVVPELPTGDAALVVQSDYNAWLFDAIVALDKGLGEIEPVYVNENPPADIVPGALWYDTEALELSIAYDDGDSVQWVPVSAAYNYDDDLTDIRALVSTETRHRERDIHQLQERLNSIDISDAAEITNIQATLVSHQQQIDAIPTVDLEPYLKEITFNAALASIDTRINQVKAQTDTLGTYATSAALSASVNNLQTSINGKASTAELNAVQAAIPDVSAFTTQADIDTSIDNITTEYLPRTGGVLDGSFIIQKTNYGLPAFDFSQASWYGKDAFKLTANAPTTGNNSTFGTTDNFWEYAWNFSADEDYCWIYNDTNKVFSITKEGPACSTLVLGDFGDNTANGRVIHNKIDVKERLNTYQTAFEQMRQGVSNATDFDSLKANILSALASV